LTNYKIKINIELVECNESESAIGKEDDGGYSITISESDASSIDRCERSLLQTAYPAIREKLADHFSEISKKKALENAKIGQTVTENKKMYKVDGEVGRFEFKTHAVENRFDFPVFNSALDVFGPLGSKEYYRTEGFKEIAYIYGDTEKSYRKTAALVNRFRFQQKGGTPHRTLQESTEKEGAVFLEHIVRRAERVLDDNGFDETGGCSAEKGAFGREKPTVVEGAAVVESAVKFSDFRNARDLLNNPVPFESPEDTVNIYIDDVNVKKQEEKRPERTEPKETQRKYVHNTIARVEKGSASYVLSGYGAICVLRTVLAFLLENGLEGFRLQFFTDGHTTLNSTIFKFFRCFRNIGIILDWYHLDKKCRERLSMVFRNRRIRNQVLDKLMPLLWHGLVDEAIELLEGTRDEFVKNREEMQKMLAYLERNRDLIPCYAIRKDLGLRNGSSIGEKMNDLIVSDRQKHNGMSWSREGSVALAALNCMKLNNEYGKWFKEGEIDFKLAA
jgi:hypothetical protein